MPDITFHCLHCRKRLQIDENAAGMRVRCPACGEITVPRSRHVESSPRIGKPRPASVAVFGVLSTVFGGLGILWAPFGARSTFALSVVYAIWLLVLGIGLLNGKRWSRTGSIAYGWFMTLWILSSVIMSCSALAGGGVSLSDEATAIFIGESCGRLIGLAYPIALIVFMNRPAAVESCTS